MRKRAISRRVFLRRSAGGAGWLALGGVALAGEYRRASSPYAAELEQASRIDPKLLRFEQAGRFACPAPGPRRLAVGPDDHLYIASRKGVSVVGPEGSLVREIPLAGPARGVAVAGDGTIYAGLRDHIEVFDPQGRPLASWQSPGRKVWLTGLAVAGTQVFAADAGNRAVLRYERSGKLAGRFGEKNKDRGIPGLIVPSPYLDVKAAPDGLLRVNNFGRHSVEVYHPGGELTSSWGRPGAAIERFCGCCNPVGVALLPDGRCVTCEKGLPRVKIYSPDGVLESVVAGPESFPENAKAGDESHCTRGGLDAAVDSRGRIFVLDLIAEEVRVMRAKA